MSFWCLYCWLWTYLTSFSSVFIVDFEQVNVSWKMGYREKGDLCSREMPGQSQQTQKRSVTIMLPSLLVTSNRYLPLGLGTSFQANIYLFKVNNRDTRWNMFKVNNKNINNAHFWLLIIEHFLKIEESKR